MNFRKLFTLLFIFFLFNQEEVEATIMPNNDEEIDKGKFFHFYNLNIKLNTVNLFKKNQLENVEKSICYSKTSTNFLMIRAIDI